MLRRTPSRRWLHYPVVATTVASVAFVTLTTVLTRPAFPETVTVVNMIPRSLSGETGQDSEPNIAVDPSNVNHVVGSAFTRNPLCPLGAPCPRPAPIFLSRDRGRTWEVNNIIPSDNGMTGDISVGFAQRGGHVYIGILRGGAGYQMQLLRMADPFTGLLIRVPDTLLTRTPADQPWAEVNTTDVLQDRPYFGFNDRSGSFPAGVAFSLDAARDPPPAGMRTTFLGTRRRLSVRAMPAVRVSAHDDGHVYAIYYRMTGGAGVLWTCDVVVARDDRGPRPGLFENFTDLIDPRDDLPGVLVVPGVTVPAFPLAAPPGPAWLGNNRLVASNLSIAVDATWAGRVWIAWADRPAGGTYTLHLRRSETFGRDWSDDLLTIPNATNPALAVNSDGTVGLLFQQLTGTIPTRRWVTHFRRRALFATTFSDLILASTPANSPTPSFQPYLGDYTRVVAVGRSFFGVFSASNLANRANFPAGVRYQRNANFDTNTLLALDLVTPVSPSIDPFFFSVDP
jgi:hypothetical protein